MGLVLGSTVGLRQAIGPSGRISRDNYHPATAPGGRTDSSDRPFGTRWRLELLRVGFGTARWKKRLFRLRLNNNKFHLAPTSRCANHHNFHPVDVASEFFRSVASRGGRWCLATRRMLVSCDEAEVGVLQE